MNKFPSEYDHKESREEFYAEKILGFMGRMVGGSKSIYRYDNPTNIVVFNANLFTSNGTKIWYGDLDLTLDSDKLKQLSSTIKEDIYVLYETDGRFENEKKPKLNNAVAVYGPGGSISLKESSYFYIDEAGIPRAFSDEELEKKIPSSPREKVVYEEDAYESIELPDLDSFKVKKNSSPLEDFQLYFINKYGREKAAEIYSRLWVTPKAYKKLTKLVTQAVKKTFKGLHPVKIEQTVSWEMFQASPMSFLDKPKWAKDSKGYLKKT